MWPKKKEPKPARLEQPNPNEDFFKHSHPPKSGKDLLHKCKRFDIFGAPIRLSYRGDYKYRTKVGSIMTLLFLLAIFTYGIILLLQFYSIYV